MRDEYWVLWHKIKVWTISPFAKYNNSKLCVENSLKNIKLHRFLWIKINNKNNSRQSFLCTQKFLDFPKIFLISPKISSFPQKISWFPQKYLHFPKNFLISPKQGIKPECKNLPAFLQLQKTPKNEISEKLQYL